MMMFNQPQPQHGENKWRSQLDQFVKENQKELAALAWGLFLEKGENNDTLGIDLQPTPRFVSCPRTAIETLNTNVKQHIQEILGVLDAYNPEQEVVMIGIGKGQIKLIQFQPEPPPPKCFAEIGNNVDVLLEQLEQRLIDIMQE